MLLIFLLPAVTQLSIIIPVWNEELQLAACLENCRKAAGKFPGRTELIVVDGESTDQTRTAAARADRLCTSPRGRGVQQNAGARVAVGEILLFLHADCRLPEDGLNQIWQALQDEPAVVGGCFEQQIPLPHWRYRWLEAGNAARVRWLGWMYGDQGIFVRREVFQQLAGFPEWPLMEDLQFSRQLRQHGAIRLLPGPLVVSPRRWQRMGVIRQTLRNWIFILLWFLGVSPTTLARWYARIR